MGPEGPVYLVVYYRARAGPGPGPGPLARATGQWPGPRCDEDADPRQVGGDVGASWDLV
jgi:hypothetical protein